MDVLEALTGNRVNYSVNVLGGVKFDVDEKQADDIRRGVDYLEERMHHYLKVVTTDTMFLQRTRGMGTLTTEQALDIGVIGPMARASGILRDVRVDAPYAAYVDFPVNAVVETAGDLEARFVVRIKELFESDRLIREILDNMPAGELTTRMPRKVKEGETISRVEAPRGECVLLHQERRRRKTGAHQGPHAQPVQLHVRHHHRAVGISWPTCR